MVDRKLKIFQDEQLENPVFLGLIGVSFIGLDVEDDEARQRTSLLRTSIKHLPFVSNIVFDHRKLAGVIVSMHKMTIQEDQIFEGQVEVVNFVLNLVKHGGWNKIRQARKEYSGLPRQKYDELLQEYGLK